jgi:hypothetical protein
MSRYKILKMQNLDIYIYIIWRLAIGNVHYRRLTGTKKKNTKNKKFNRRGYKFPCV